MYNFKCVESSECLVGIPEAILLFAVVTAWELLRVEFFLVFLLFLEYVQSHT